MWKDNEIVMKALQNSFIALTNNIGVASAFVKKDMKENLLKDAMILMNALSGEFMHVQRTPRKEYQTKHV